MPLSNLADYYCCHDEMFVVPIEALSVSGMVPEFAGLLRARRHLPDGWIELFDQSFRAYWERSRELATRAPQHWLPPRYQHCCIVADTDRVRPYFQPFNNSAWLLYEADFDPACSNPELGAYLFLHMERMGILRDVTKTLLHNLSYWLARSDAESESFAAACLTSTRPDAAGFRALAAALPWVRQLRHEVLKPAPLVSLTPPSPSPGTGLLVPAALQPRLDGLLRQWGQAAQTCLDAFHAAHARRGKDRAGELCAWLQSAVPYVLVTSSDGRVVWDPTRPTEVDAVRRAVGGLGQTAAASIQADLAVIDRHSRAFLRSLRQPEQLPTAHADTAQNGLSYLHRERGLIAYNLREPGMERLRVPAPPFERLMLGARTVHEWGHLAADAGWISVPTESRSKFDAAVDELRDEFERLWRDAPPTVRAFTAPEGERLRGQHGSVGEGLLRIPLTRMPDYQANLLARRYLSADELETYVRNNVYCLRWTSRPAAVFQRLARYVYEYQYLPLSRIEEPRRYFLGSTWFAEEYVASGIVGEAAFERLLSLTGRLCAVQTVDESKFLPPP